MTSGPYDQPHSTGCSSCNSRITALTSSAHSRGRSSPREACPTRHVREGPSPPAGSRWPDPSTAAAPGEPGLRKTVNEHNRATRWIARLSTDDVNRTPPPPVFDAYCVASLLLMASTTVVLDGSGTPHAQVTHSLTHSSGCYSRAPTSFPASGRMRTRRWQVRNRRSRSVSARCFAVTASRPG